MEKLEACCVKHNKIFSIVCLDDQCENRGVLCSECLNFHIGHTMISLEKYEKEVHQMVNNLLSQGNSLMKQRNSLKAEARKRFTQVREQVNALFEEQIENVGRSSQDYQDLINVHFAPLKGIFLIKVLMNLGQQTKQSNLVTSNENFINALAYLDNSDDISLKLDPKYYSFLDDQKEYVLKLKQATDCQNNQDLSWLNSIIESFVEDCKKSEQYSLEGSFDISPNSKLEQMSQN